MFMCSTCLFKRPKWIPTILPTFQKLSLFHKFLLPGFGNFLEKFCFGEDHCFLLTCSLAKFFLQHPTNIYLFKVNNRNTRKRWKVCSKLIKKFRMTSFTSFWWFYCKLWTNFTLFSSVPIVDFEQVNVSLVTSDIFRWGYILLYI